MMFLEQNPPICSQKCRQFQFQEIMEGTYKAEKSGQFWLNEGYVQAAFISIEKKSGASKTGKTQLLLNFFKENTSHIFYYRDYIVLLFDNMPESAVISLLENLYGYLMKSVHWCVITLGGRCLAENTLPDTAIRKTCREAEALMENTFFYGDKKILTPYDIPAANNGKDLDINEEAKKLCSYIQVVDNEKIKSFFQDFREGLLQSGKPPREIRQDCLQLMLEVRGEMIKKFPALKEKLGTGGEITGGIMREHYLEQVVKTMLEASLRISEALPLLSAGLNFKRIVSYVNNNYGENLKLDTLAQLFNYNCSYLGKYFKKNTGMNFHAYLDSLRIDTAKEMLQNTSMKVYEISNAVGFTNTDYFYSKFKKYTGKSPLFFRKNEKYPIFTEK
jgi:two-component system response regulator YesN